ncbi:response regulator [Agrobacterium vitis]|uniref:histidine kinase n=1 Tax=Agrobacterium vitis TaxID=373 RepID=A0A368P0A9_AGRVI|nr:hybrid sensor histidine kinase/response regulator [Agrobacterium vitis]KAA3507480.1 hybrid sensor histidine kinase/response regulator [Agrobacterium vitis]KAA3521145.1 hybrid sensor histidine kinase/response regulator [Agrobacterium vitis]MCF1480061.1 response regulator [Agrobacterium vitis]MUZ96820.1 response regulator [Agrobacterium vitis]MVA31834.1 response regulator [Agrobacterium vitis]
MRNDASFDTERAQAIMRIAVIFIIVAYVMPLVANGATPPEARSFYWLFSIYIPYSFLLLLWIVLRPGVDMLRRTIVTLLDYAFTTFAMSVGGAPLFPIAALVVWHTVVSGLRFGPKHLLPATALALSSFAIATYFNVYWQQNPYVVLTFIMMAILAPSYTLAFLLRLQSAYAAEQEANLSKSRFLAHASHDLRQPIHAISLFTACLRDAGLKPDELAMVDNIDRSLQSVSRLFKSLLDISTLDSGKLIPQMETVAIADILNEVVDQNMEAAQKAGSQLRLVNCTHFVAVDRSLLNTILQNILSNAIKYAGGRKILIGCRRRGGSLTIQVYDQGPGIAPEHHLRIFEEFYQVRERGDKDVDGVGLGLAIVKRLGTLMGLKVSLRSVVGAGTTISVSGLKIAVPMKVLSAEQIAPSATNLAHGLRVLLVEDDEAVLLATASLLRKWGCTVQAETAIPSVLHHCDLLITDFDLGGRMTGTECIAKVRQLAGWKVPAVVMTGHAPSRVIEDIADSDIPILSKPVRPAELRSAILLPGIGAPLR